MIKSVSEKPTLKSSSPLSNRPAAIREAAQLKLTLDPLLAHARAGGRIEVEKNAHLRMLLDSPNSLSTNEVETLNKAISPNKGPPDRTALSGLQVGDRVKLDLTYGSGPESHTALVFGVHQGDTIGKGQKLDDSFVFLVNAKPNGNPFFLTLSGNPFAPNPGTNWMDPKKAVVTLTAGAFAG